MSGVLFILFVLSMVFLLPLKDRRSRRRDFPWMTATIVILNVLIHAWVTATVYLPSDSHDSWLTLYPYMEVPRLIMDGEGLGALSILTSAFLHAAGLSHLLGNMFILWFFGRKVEDSTGPFHFALFYLLCGFTAGLGSVLIRSLIFPSDAYVPGLGASGAIAGVMAAYLFLYSDQKVLTLIALRPPSGVGGCLIPLPIPLWLPSWVFILYSFITDALWAQFALEVVKRDGIVPLGVNVFAHIGGAAGGFLFIYFFIHPDVFARRR